MRFFETLISVLEEASLDTLKALPILFCVYILVSYFEHNTHKHFNFLKKAEKFGPVVGASLGIVPQCGFSVAMADLYNKKNITLGTLIAVIIATSDEAIPLLMSDYSFVPKILALIAIKFVYAILCGYAIDIILTLLRKKQQNKIEFAHCSSHTPCECGHEEHSHENHSCCADNIFIDAIKHTLKIALFIFVINLLLGLLIELSGVNLGEILNVGKYAQPFITAAIGLIPNCFASVLLVEVYMLGGITFGSLLSGLCTGAGLGLLFLFKNTKNWKKNLLIVSIVYILGAILGLLVNIIV